MKFHPALGADQRQLLADFLRAADMVKFALHRPPRPESEAALNTARTFVEQTALHEDSQDSPAGRAA